MFKALLLALPCLIVGVTGSVFAKPTTVVPPILDFTAIKDGQGGRAAVDPCDNFYEYSCGAWIDRTIIPSDKERVGRQTTAATDASQETLRDLLDAYSRGDFSIPSRYAGKLSDFYGSCLNVDHNEAASLKTLQQEIAVIRATKGRTNTARLLARLSSLGVNALFANGSNQDPNDSTKVVLALLQGGLSFKSKTYYLDQDAKAVETRAKYVEYLTEMFRLLGDDAGKANRAATSVLAFETKLARHEYSLEDLQDPSRTNHPMNRAEVLALTPDFDMDEYLNTIGLAALNEFSVMTPEYLTAAAKITARASPDELANYLVAQLMAVSQTYLSAAFRQNYFAFWGTYLSGQQALPPRWKTCVALTSKLLGYPLAEAYVSTFDGAPIRQKTEEMIDQIKMSFVENLAELNAGPQSWIDDETLKGAVDKVGKVAQKIGAPTVYRDYDGVKLLADRALVNAFRLNQFETARDLAKVGQPVDRSEWEMMPWEVNAYYSRSNNEFNFPFGILQPPSLDLQASDGANYGAFGGGTIGHELLHGFDKNGAKYDAGGNLRDWWSASTSKQFATRAKCYVDQADTYRIESLGLNVNGGLTIDENLADQGGVKLGYHALTRILSNRAERPPLNGYSERQQYWLAYAQSWCVKSTPAQLRKQALTDVHPIAEYRVNGVMMNRPEFARDFSCKTGSRMAPLNRCAIW